jgi:hypothetical protein
VKKGKILAGLLAALLILSILPAAGLASVLDSTGTLWTQVPNTGTTLRRIPIVFSYEDSFIDWMSRVSAYGNEAVGSWLAPVIDGNRLQLVFGGEQNNVKEFTGSAQSAIKGYFEKAHFSEVDIWLTNLSPRYENAATGAHAERWAYPTVNLQAWDNSFWPISDKAIDRTVSYVYVGKEQSPFYERISNFIGLIGESTRVVVHISDELDTFNVSASPVITRYLASDGKTYTADELPADTYFVNKEGNGGLLLDKNGKLLWIQDSTVSRSDGGRPLLASEQSRINEAVVLPDGIPVTTVTTDAGRGDPSTSSTVAASGFTYVSGVVNSVYGSYWAKSDQLYFLARVPTSGGVPVYIFYPMWIYEDGLPKNPINISVSDLNSGVSLVGAFTLLTDTNVPEKRIASTTGGVGATWVVRQDPSYHIGNYQFNDLTSVSIIVDKNTNLSVSASSHLDDVTVEKDGYLNLTKVNYTILNSLYTKMIDTLTLKAGSVIDFPVGTTKEIAEKWFGKALASYDFIIRVNGKNADFSGGSTVPPTTVAIKIGASHASPTSVSLNWNAAAGATGYSLYQASSSAGSYQLTASNTQSLSAVATGLATGSYYWFKASAVDAKGEIAVSDPIQVRARPLRPASINAAAGSKTGSAKVSWGSVAECDGYAVYVSTSRTGAYTLKSVVSGRDSLSAQVTGLKSGATYYFKVASYVQVGPAKVPSVYTGVVSAKAK